MNLAKITPYIDEFLEKLSKAYSPQDFAYICKYMESVKLKVDYIVFERREFNVSQNYFIPIENIDGESVILKLKTIVGNVIISGTLLEVECPTA